MRSAKLKFIDFNAAGSWLSEKYAHALQSAGAAVELVTVRFDDRQDAITGLCNNLVPQRTFGFHYRFRSQVRLLKAVERMWVDLRKAAERRKLGRYLRQSDATHFVAADPLALGACVGARKSAGGKIFYLPFEHYRDHLGVGPRHKRQFIRLESQGLPHVAAAIYCGDEILKDYTGAYGAAERSHVVYNGWPLGLTAQRKALRQAAGLTANRVIVLYQGAIELSRGVTDVVEAMAALPKQACFVLVGYGHGREAVTAAARAAGVSDRVLQLPAVPQQELMNYSADADIGIIPLRGERSHRYACPGKLFEFIGAGLPLVVSDMPDLQRFVTRYGLGEVFPSGDRVALGRALGPLVESAERRRQCALNARALHESTVCWEVQSRKLCDIILT